MGTVNANDLVSKILGLFQGGNTGIILKIVLGVLGSTLFLWVGYKIKEWKLKLAHTEQEDKFMQDQRDAAKKNEVENKQATGAEQTTDDWAEKQRETKGT